MIKSKKLLALSIILQVLFSCSEEEFEPDLKSVEINNNSKKTVNQSSKVIVPIGDVTDVKNYSPKPYRTKGAGYSGRSLGNLPNNRKVLFSHVNNKNDTKELEKVINTLSEAGGGEITIKKGDYEFRQVDFKSNIHVFIEAGTTIRLDSKIGGKRFPFSIGLESYVENVRIIGLGNVYNRPKFILEKDGEKFMRAINMGFAKNVLVENFTIKDDLTGGTAIAFNPVLINGVAKRPENITIANIKMSVASQGYGLVQTNVGKNILFKNLSCVGGMTCRIESHTGRKYGIGVSNIIIENVVSIRGKAAVLLQPHSVENGRVLVDVARSEGSAWTLFIAEGFVSKESLRKEKGHFGVGSRFKNISMESNDFTAKLSFKNLSFLPEKIKEKYMSPYLRPIRNDHNYSVNSEGILSKEASIKGPSVAVIYKSATYPVGLPSEKDLLLEGEIDNRLKIFNIIK